MNTAFQIRPLQPDDVGAFFALLQAKAAFDGCPESLLATEASLRAALFGPGPVTRALVAVVDGRLIGMATFYAIFSTFIMQPGLWLDDLYLDPAHRGKGIGRAMMAQLASIASAAGCERLDWIVATANRDGKRFYERIGANISDQVQLCRLTGPAIRRLADNQGGSRTRYNPA